MHNSVPSRRVSVLNFPKTNALQADISALDESGWSFVLGRDKPRLDLLIGGPPCQGFSRMGKHQKDDPRNSLIGHFFRHVQLLKPRILDRKSTRMNSSH